MQKEERIKDLNNRLQLKAQQQQQQQLQQQQKNNKLSDSASAEPTTNDCKVTNQGATNKQTDGALTVGTLVNITPCEVNSDTPAIKESKEPQSTVVIDPGSDSALLTSSTTKSSKTSASEENYSESYC